MTAPEIAARLVSRPITPDRVRKLQKLCTRVSVPLSDVLALLTEDQRQAVEGGA